MKPDWCDEKTWDAALNAVSDAIGGKKSLDEFAQPVARALLSAYNRGLEDAIGLAQQEIDEARVNASAQAAMGAKFVRDAIRAKVKHGAER